MVNQILIATGMIGVCEALLYGYKAGLNLETVMESVASGAAGSWSLSNYGPRLLKGDLSAFWHDSIVYQSDRTTPFSIWGLWGGLGWEQSLLQGAVIALALGVAFLPSRRTLIDVAALGAGVLIALQLTLNYWLYPYIVWFFPLVLVALFAAHPEPGQHLYAAWDSIGEEPSEPPAPAPAPPASVANWSAPPPSAN